MEYYIVQTKCHHDQALNGRIFRFPPLFHKTNNQTKTTEQEMWKLAQGCRAAERCAEVKHVFACVGHTRVLVNLKSKMVGRTFDAVVKKCLGPEFRVSPMKAQQSGEKFRFSARSVTHKSTMEREAAACFRTGQGTVLLIRSAGEKYDELSFDPNTNPVFKLVGTHKTSEHADDSDYIDVGGQESQTMSGHPHQVVEGGRSHVKVEASTEGLVSPDTGKKRTRALEPSETPPPPPLPTPTATTRNLSNSNSCQTQLDCSSCALTHEECVSLDEKRRRIEPDPGAQQPISRMDTFGQSRMKKPSGAAIMAAVETTGDQPATAVTGLIQLKTAGSITLVTEV